MKYSVLMSVYYKENPCWFKESIESMLCQTIQPAEFVLICDGPLTNELNDVIQNFLSKYKNFKVHRLPENKGLGKALRYGVTQCSNEIIFRMDADDISIEDRCEKQLREFEFDNKLIIVGSNVLEFGDGAEIVKRVPEKDFEIRKYSKKRSPFNHPTVAFKKSAVLAVGNYKDSYLSEDYELWMRMLNELDGNVKNIQENLVLMRVDENLYARRGGLKYALAESKLQRSFWENKYINFFEYILNLIIRVPIRLIPNRSRRFFYKKILRRKH